MPIADGQTSCKVWLTSVKRRRCSNETKTRNPLKFAGLPQTRQLVSISSVSSRSSPYCGGMWRRYCCLRSFFPDCRLSSLRRYSPTKLCDGVQMANFCVLFASCISASRVQHISDLHSKFALSPHHVSKYGRHPTATAEIRRGKKKREETGQKYDVHICCAGRP